MHLLVFQVLGDEAALDSGIELRGHGNDGEVVVQQLPDLHGEQGKVGLGRLGLVYRFADRTHVGQRPAALGPLPGFAVVACGNGSDQTWSSGQFPSIASPWSGITVVACGNGSDQTWSSGQFPVTASLWSGITVVACGNGSDQTWMTW